MKADVLPMNPKPDDLRASAAECREKAGRTYPANRELWLQITAAYSSLVDEAEKSPTAAVIRTQG
jgi:hypothetical protein